LTCLACHSMYQSHPVDIDYEQAASRQGAGLREAREVLRRGIFLPAGRLTCFTCHDGNSRWKHRLAIPPGAEVRPAVVPGDRTTYDVPQTPSRTITAEAAKATLPSGSAVSPKPLCLACHAMD